MGDSHQNALGQIERRAARTRWHTGWVRRNWRNASGDPVANMDLWRRLLDAAKPHEIDWRWVRGHSGDPMNERADVLATEARERITAH